MNDLTKLVTPLTRGIIWLLKDEICINSPHYTQIDYLLDGLLTANLQVSSIASNKVIVGQSFNKTLYVLIVHEPIPSEIQSYVSLLKELGPEDDIIVIDESQKLQELKKEFKSISSSFKVI